MKPHPISSYILFVILANFCNAQNGYYYNRPTGRPFTSTSNNQIPGVNQKSSGTYQPQGSQKSYQNDISSSGYQYNRPLSKYSTTASPQSQIVGFPQPFRPNNGSTPQTAQINYPTMASPSSELTYLTTPRGNPSVEFSTITSNPPTSRGPLEDGVTLVTSSPFKSRGSLGAGTAAIISSPFDISSTTKSSINDNYNYLTPVPSVMSDQDYGKYQTGSIRYTIPDSGYNYISNNQFGGSPSTQQPINGNTVPRGSLDGHSDALGYNNFDSSTEENLGINTDYFGNFLTSTPISGSGISENKYNLRPGTSDPGSYTKNSETGTESSNIYNKNLGYSNQNISTSDGNTRFSNLNDQNSENLIPQGTSNFSPGAMRDYGSHHTYGESSETQRPNNFSAGNAENAGVLDSINIHHGNIGIEGPNNFNGDNSNVGGRNSGYGGSSGLPDSNAGIVGNFGSNHVYNGLSGNQESMNVNLPISSIMGPGNLYSNNFGIQRPNNDFVKNFATNRPTTFIPGRSNNQIPSSMFNGNPQRQQRPNNAFRGILGLQSLDNAFGGNHVSQSPSNLLQSGTEVQGSSNLYEGNIGWQGLKGNNISNLENIEPNFSALGESERPYDKEISYNNDYSAIPGTPDIDYPILSEIPITKFNCTSQKYPGYYADTETRCQVFHVCANSLKYDFLCPNGTIFHQMYSVCVWWNQFDCNTAQSLYTLNENFHDYDKQFTSANFDPLSSQPYSNYNTQLSPKFGALFGGLQGSSPAPFTTAEFSKKPSYSYSTPEILASRTLGPESNYRSSGINHQQSDFSASFAPGYSSISNNNQGFNYSTTVVPNHIFGTEVTDRPPIYSPLGYSGAAITSSDSISSPYTSFSTTPATSASSTPGPQSNYSPSRINHQQSAFNAGFAPGFSSKFNNNQGFNYPTTVAPNHAFSTGVTDGPPTNSSIGHFGAAITSPDGTSSPYASFSTTPATSASNTPRSQSNYSPSRINHQQSDFKNDFTPGYSGTSNNNQGFNYPTAAAHNHAFGMGIIDGQPTYSPSGYFSTFPDSTSSPYIPFSTTPATLESNVPGLQSYFNPSGINHQQSVFNGSFAPRYSGTFNSNQGVNYPTKYAPSISVGMDITDGSPTYSPLGYFGAAVTSPGSTSLPYISSSTPPLASVSSTPIYQSKYKPSGINGQQSVFGASFPPRYSSTSNNNQGFNYPSAVAPNQAFGTGVTDRPPTYSPLGYFGAAETSPDNTSSPYISFSTTPETSVSNTPRPQHRYSPLGINNQQSDFNANFAPKYSSTSNKNHGFNYPTTVAPNRAFGTDITAKIPTYSPLSYSGAAVTSPDSTGFSYNSFSTTQPESYSTESNVPSNTFNVPEMETTFSNNIPFSLSNQQMTKLNREYLPPFRKRR